MRRRLRAAAVLALAVGLMAWFLRNADLDRVAAALAGARWDLAAAALALTCASYVVRAVRWRGLLRPLGPVGLGTAFRATVMGFAASTLLPGRVGELLRPWVLARREGLSATAALATIVLERLLDLAAVLALLALAALFAGIPAGEAGAGLTAAVRSGAAAAGVLAAAALGAAWAAAGRRERVTRAARRAAALLPARAAAVVERAAGRFAEGFGVLRDRRDLAAAAAWTALHWVVVAAILWLVTVGFGIALPAAGAPVLMFLTVVGVAAPTPAGIGGYHAAYQAGATLLYGAPEAAAVAAALVLHAMSFLPVTLVGIVFMLQEGIRPGAVRRLADASAEGRGA